VRELHRRILPENLKGIDHLRDLGTDEIIRDYWHEDGL
jgi:hypothetical protein